MAGTRLSAATLVIGMIRISSTMLTSPPRNALAIAFRLNCGFDSNPTSSDIGALLYALIIKRSHERIEGRFDPSTSSDLGVGLKRTGELRASGTSIGTSKGSLLQCQKASFDGSSTVSSHAKRQSLRHGF